MKPNIVPTQREIELGANDVIVSKTDLQGRLTYANRKFMQIADYSERDLIGVQHNIIRHPDMPRGAFKLDTSSRRPVVLLSGGVGLTPGLFSLQPLSLQALAIFSVP